MVKMEAKCYRTFKQVLEQDGLEDEDSIDSIGEAETLINHYDINKDITDSDRSSSLLDTIIQ